MPAPKPWGFKLPTDLAIAITCSDRRAKFGAGKSIDQLSTMPLTWWFSDGGVFV